MRAQLIEFTAPSLYRPPQHIYGQMPDYGDDWIAFTKYYVANIWKGTGKPKMALMLLNNPTGAGVTAAFFRELVKWARKNEIIIAQDAAYCELYFGKPVPSIFETPGARDVAVEFYSASKTYCMAGWRAGWVVGNSKLVCALNQLKENIDSGQFNAVQNAVAFALRNHEKIVPGIRERFRLRAEAR